MFGLWGIRIKDARITEVWMYLVDHLSLRYIEYHASSLQHGVWINISPKDREWVCSDIYRMEVESRLPLVSDVRRVSKEDMSKALLEEDNIWRLFPHRKVVVGWEPFRLIPANMKFVESLVFNAYGTPTKVPTKNPHSYDTLTFGTVANVERGLRYYIDVYGESTEDAVAHVFHHLRSLWQAYHGRDTCIMVFIPSTMKTAEFRANVNKFLSVTTKEGRECTLFEGPYLPQVCSPMWSVADPGGGGVKPPFRGVFFLLVSIWKFPRT